ncbi:MAG: hypothetical protein ACK5RL_20985 [Acidimicrobiales bacterium]
MATDQPIHSDQLEPEEHGERLSELLLRAGGRSADPNNAGVQDFDLVSQLFPVEYQVFQRAISEFGGRMKRFGASNEDTERALGEARHLLMATLNPFTEIGVGDAKEPLETSSFRALTRRWVGCQIERCTSYIVGLTIQDYNDQLASSSTPSPEEQHMLRLLERIRQFENQPDAALMVDKDRREVRRLAAAVAKRPDLDPVVPRALSFLLGQTADGRLRPTALAALLLKGNNSPGSEGAANPLQILSVNDVATVLAIPRESVTTRVSRIRSKAREHREIANIVHELNPRLLWTAIGPNDDDVRSFTNHRKGRQR